jgi:hypothetical protein
VPKPPIGISRSPPARAEQIEPEAAHERQHPQTGKIRRMDFVPGPRSLHNAYGFADDKPGRLGFSA